nr:transposase [Microvirga calopogonii]
MKNSVHPADIHDRAGAELLLEGLQHLFPAIERLWADTAYRGLKDWLSRALGWKLSIPQHWWSGGVWMRADAEPPTRPSGFQVLARRWVVERTIGWLTTNRRLAKDYERLVETGEILLYLKVILAEGIVLDDRVFLPRDTEHELAFIISQQATLCHCTPLHSPGVMIKRRPGSGPGLWD